MRALDQRRGASRSGTPAMAFRTKPGKWSEACPQAVPSARPCLEISAYPHGGREWQVRLPSTSHHAALGMGCGAMCARPPVTLKPGNRFIVVVRLVVSRPVSLGSLAQPWPPSPSPHPFSEAEATTRSRLVLDARAQVPFCDCSLPSTRAYPPARTTTTAAIDFFTDYI